MEQFKTQPYKHQFDAFEQSKDREGFALLMEMGTGKSKIAIDTAAYLSRAGKIRGLLLLANKGSYRNWSETQLPIHMPDDVVYETYVWGDMDGHRKGTQDLKILVMNTEALAYDRGFQEAKHFIELMQQRVLIVVDESTMIKNPDAKRTKATITLARACAYRRIMTGSPITNSPLDLYAQCQALGPGMLGFTSYYAFRAQYAVMVSLNAGQRSFKKVTGYKNLEQLTNRLKTFSFIIKKDECLDLPAKIYQKHMVVMTSAQKQAYESMRKDSIVEFQNTPEALITAPLVITKLVKLHQIVCGFIKDDFGVIHEVENNRLSGLLEVIEEAPGKVIIWATYRHNIASIVSILSKNFSPNQVVSYHGGTSDEDRKLAVKSFQEGEARFFVGTPKTGGYSLTLTAAETVIYYSNSYDLEQRLQSEDRAHRIGQTKHVNYVDLECPSTVDEKIIKALREKKKVAELVLGNQWVSWL